MQSILLKFSILVFVSVFISKDITAQNPYEKQGIKLFGNFYHQHHNFYNEVFSYQGVEVSAQIKNSVFMGIYGSCFVTNLKAEINSIQEFIWIGQTGIQGGYVFLPEKRIHPGLQFSTGIFSQRNDVKSFGLFDTGKAIENGLVFSPQLFAELNIAKWFKIRTGLSYNSYFPFHKTELKSSDLNNISFIFGLVFISF